MNDKEQVFAVLRIDVEARSKQNPGDSISVTQVLPTREQALEEVARLNALNRDKGVQYTFQATRLFKRRGGDVPAVPTEGPGHQLTIHPVGDIEAPTDFPLQPYQAIATYVEGAALREPNKSR